MTAQPDRPRPLGSLIASARRLTSQTINQRGSTTPKPWQADAWDMFDLVGEHRFLSTTLAGRMSQARLYIGRLPDDPAEEPEPVTDPAITGILEAIGSSAAARAQIVYRLGVNLFVPGDAWLAGIPRTMMPPSLLPPASLLPTDQETADAADAPDTMVDPGSIDITDLEWRALSISECTTDKGGRVTLRLGELDDDKVICSPDDVFLIRVWRPHPNHSWEADSPTRSNLPVLREIVGLTMKTSAQIDSRLAGAGLLIVPASATRALRIAAGLPEDTDADPFTDALIEAMMTPISDRSSAAAVVPLVVTVPDEAADKFTHLTFDKPMDKEDGPTLEGSIRRFALGSDAPPELLLGTAGMNHWGGWLMQRDVVTTHLEPPLALICDALTSQYLWPVLADMGRSPDEAHRYVFWYDVKHLVARPNQSEDAFHLHDSGAISDAALRDATGFDESDAPDTDRLPPEVGMALELVKASPALAANPGLPQLVAQIRAILEGDIPEVEDPTPAPVPPQLAPAEPPPADGSPPATDAAPPAVPPAVAASGHQETHLDWLDGHNGRDVLAEHGM